MKIGLHDADCTGYPNLALMKISAHEKSLGNDVCWLSGFNSDVCDVIYSSKVFSYPPAPFIPPEKMVYGGYGYGSSLKLRDDIEHICPDYSIYNCDHSMGFLTRGCPNSCEWCIVPSKEGGIRPHADIEEFVIHKEVVLMDNNVLAHPHGIHQIEKIAGMGIAVDFNQGLDARLIDDSVAKLLGRVKWKEPVRLACDHKSQMSVVQKAVQALRWHNVTPSRYSCYVLVTDVADAVERVRFLKGLGVDPFAQPYRDREGTPPTDLQKAFARWVNRKQIFKKATWEEYCESKDIQQGELSFD